MTRFFRVKPVIALCNLLAYYFMKQKEKCNECKKIFVPSKQLARSIKFIRTRGKNIVPFVLCKPCEKIRDAKNKLLLKKLLT